MYSILSKKICVRRFYNNIVRHCTTTLYDRLYDIACTTTLYKTLYDRLYDIACTTHCTKAKQSLVPQHCTTSLVPQHCTKQHCTRCCRGAIWQRFNNIVRCFLYGALCCGGTLYGRLYEVKTLRRYFVRRFCTMLLYKVLLRSDFVHSLVRVLHRCRGALYDRLS